MQDNGAPCKACRMISMLYVRNPSMDENGFSDFLGNDNAAEFVHAVDNFSCLHIVALLVSVK